VKDEMVARTLLGLHRGDVRAAITSLQAAVKNFAMKADCEYSVALECFNRFCFSEINALEGYRNALVPFFATESGIREEWAKHFLEEAEWKINTARLNYRKWFLHTFQEHTGVESVDELKLCRDLLKEHNYNFPKCMDAFTKAVADQIGWN
jgi:hypothetical protein